MSPTLTGTRTLTQVLSFDMMNMRYRLRGLVGADVPDFLNRLQNVGLQLSNPNPAPTLPLPLPLPLPRPLPLPLPRSASC